MSASPVGGIRFGVFEVDLRSGELRKHGIRIKLQDQPFKILAALLEKPGDVVTREELKQRIWGNDTFVDFDHGLSAAVNRLREALGDSVEKPRYVETMARRGYRFIAPVEGRPQPPPDRTVPGRSHRKLVWAAAALFAAGGVALWLARDNPVLPAPRVELLTTFAGTETQPTFSPDGKHVAFAGDGETQDNRDIYVKMVGGATALRLTSDPAVDAFPAWSPDGTQIAFLSNRGLSGLYLVSPLGGPDRKLIDLPITGRPAWSPDGKYLVVSRVYHEQKPEPGDGALFLIPVAGRGEPRPLLVPQSGTRYSHPAVAPSGVLAFASCIGPAGAPACEIQMVALNDGLLPRTAPRRISKQHTWVSGLAWADGNSVIFSAYANTDGVSGWLTYLWRVSVAGREEAKPERLEVAGAGALYPAIDRGSNRLAFSRSVAQADLWRLELKGKPAPFLTSTLRDSNPQFSADGRRIAFESGRSGDEQAIWVANADGTGLAQITKSLCPRSGTPRWSPDGQWLAFDAQGKDGLWDIWVVQPSGGPPRQLTNGAGNNAVPSWSRNGKWVYFVSSRSGRGEIWRLPADAGPVEQITRNGGIVAFESTDGKALYYTKSLSGSEGLYTIPLAGGQEKQVLRDQVIMRSFVVFPDGIYYTTTPLQQSGAGQEAFHAADLFSYLIPYGNQHRYEIRFHEFVSGRSHVVAEIRMPIEQGLSVSPDRSVFLFSAAVPSADLMLIENFR